MQFAERQFPTALHMKGICSMSIYNPMNLPSGFYVYAYIRTNGTPYYIGKGQTTRAWLQHRYNGKGVHTPPNERIIVLEANLTEIGAFSLERRMIRWYGRKDTNTGILHNRTAGGDGTSGFVRPQYLKDSQSKWVTELNKKRLAAGTHTFQINSPMRRPEIAKKCSERMSGANNPSYGRPEVANRINAKPPKTCPYCNKVVSLGNYARWHGEKCKSFTVCC